MPPAVSLAAITPADLSFVVGMPDHPDIEAFSDAKRDPKRLRMFNVSVLVTDASLVSPRVATSPLSANGLLEPAYFAQFQPRDGKRPSWLGNVKALRFARDSAGNQRFLDAAGSNGIASDGRIASSALTIGTRGGALGGAGVDGRNTALGGVGQNIPGYQFGGGGNPGRVNADGRRQIFYDTLNASNVPSLTALDADTQTVRDALKTDLGVTGNGGESNDGTGCANAAMNFSKPAASA